MGNLLGKKRKGRHGKGERSSKVEKNNATGKKGSSDSSNQVGRSRDNTERIWGSFAATGQAPKFDDDEEISRFFDAVGVSPDGFESLVVQFFLGVKELLCFEREPFLDALDKSKTVSVAELKDLVAQWVRTACETPDVFREVYRFSFNVLKEESRGISIATAVEALQMLLGPQHPTPYQCTHTDSFIAFLTEQTEVKSLNLDQWMLFLDFSKNIPSDFANYDPTEAWPVLFDDFVNWSKRRGLLSSNQSAAAVRTVSRSASSTTSTTTETSTSTESD